MAAVTDAVERANALRALAEEVACCTRCPLHSTRTQAVFGSGHPDADLMFVGEAPGFHEDQQGVPFVGQAGKLLERLLAGIGLSRADVYIANVLKSRPPGNRDPQPEEIAACEGYLFRQIALIQPKLVATQRLEHDDPPFESRGETVPHARIRPDLRPVRRPA